MVADVLYTNDQPKYRAKVSRVSASVNKNVVEISKRLILASLTDESTGVADKVELAKWVIEQRYSFED